MGSESNGVSFLEYSQAMARMRRRAASRRAVMSGGDGWETLGPEEEEGRDLEIVSAWEAVHGQACLLF